MTGCIDGEVIARSSEGDVGISWRTPAVGTKQFTSRNCEQDVRLEWPLLTPMTRAMDL